MLEFIEFIGGGLVGFITYLGEALVAGFNSLVYEGTGENRTITDIAKFMLIMAGVLMAVGASKLVFWLVRRR